MCNCMWHFEKEDRTVWESMMNRWRGTAGLKHAHTHFRLLHNMTFAQQNWNLFENRQTVAQTVKSHHTRSHSSRSSLCCADCLTVCRALHTARQRRRLKTKSCICVIKIESSRPTQLVLLCTIDGLHFSTLLGHHQAFTMNHFVKKLLTLLGSLTM